MVPQRAGVNLHHQTVLQREPCHLHQEVAHEPPLIRRCHVALPRPLVQDLSLVRGKPGSVRLEHRVIGGSSPHALEEGAAILQGVKEFGVIHQGRAVLSAQRFQLGRPAGGRDLEHRIGPETRDHSPLPPGLPDGAVVFQPIAGLVGGGEDLDREALEQRPRPELGRGELLGDLVIDPGRSLAR
ncbi:MAG TPA: hypothetical protein VE966_12950, partial [Gemmatimonadales bacterium]|nr:hypothetical protein [Gemmatimonadales bacterium]